MDQDLLVEEQIKDGQNLVEQLNGEGIPVTAAAWIKKSEAKWYLYLVTPLVKEGGATKPAYHRISPVVRRLQEAGQSIDQFEVKAVGPTDPIAVAVTDAQREHAGKRPIRYGGRAFIGLDIEDAYIYPPPSSPAAR
jgi:hypothetical protein